MKICTKCKQEKSLNEFYTDKRTKDKKVSVCTKCISISYKFKRKKYPWKYTFKDIKTRCNNKNNKAYKWYGGRGIKCLITEDEVKRLWFRDKACLMKKPSIDRKNNDGNYEFGNCRFIEFVANIARQNPLKKEKIINQYDLQGNFIRSWKSQHEIQRILCFACQNVSNVCLKKTKRAYGFIWRFKNG